MATYVFKAMDLAGAQATGEVEAEAKQAVADQLKPRGPDRPRHRRQARLARRSASASSRRSRPHDLTIMTRQLVDDGQLGHDASCARSTCSRSRPRARSSREAIDRGPQGRRGRPAALRRARAPPEGLQRRSSSRWSRAGETGGMLDEALMRVADQLEKDGLAAPPGQVRDDLPGRRHELRRASCSSRLVAFLVPVFVGVFKEFGGDLPAITKITVGLSHVVTGTVVPADRRGRSATVVGFRKWKASERGRAQWDAFRLRIPFKIGDIVQKVALARWSRTLSRSSRAGVPLLQALDITGQDGRQHRRREGDGRRHRARQARRHDRRRRSRRRPSSRRWSPTWSAWARRPARSTRC